MENNDEQTDNKRKGAYCTASITMPFLIFLGIIVVTGIILYVIFS